MSSNDVRAALRALTQGMVEGAPYDEVANMLDGIAALPGADATEIAGRRLALLSVYHQRSRERERVLRRVMQALDHLPIREQAQWVLGACAGHRALAERHLPRLIAKLDEAGDAQGAEQLREHLEYERSRARARSRRRKLAEESTFELPPHVKRGIEVVRWLTVGRRTYQEMSEALDAIMDLPGSEVAAPRVATERLIALHLHPQDDAEVERVILQVAPVLAMRPLRDRASSIAMVCNGRPALAEKYLAPLVAELDEEQRKMPDEVTETMLAQIRRTLERTRVGTRQVHHAPDAGRRRPLPP